MDDTEIIQPEKMGYTVYTKSGCNNCTKIKHFLCEIGANMFIVNCDEYILDNKDHFMNFIKVTAKQEVRFFPIVFLNGEFIGGYNETVLHCRMFFGTS